MAVSVSTTALGAPALDALAAAVRRAQGGDPLRAVTVVVPTNTAGVMARRALGRRGGFAAIDVVTLFRLAELLGAPTLHRAGRKPVSTPVVDVAVRHVLQANPGLYAGVEHHPSTIVALRDLYRELRVAGPGAVTALARTERGGEPARVAAEVMRALRNDWYDEGDLLTAAVARAGCELPDRSSRVVVQLPQRLRPLELQLLTAIGERGSVEVVVGLTGDVHVDTDVLAVAEALADGPIPATARPPAPDEKSALGLDVVSTTDADDEVRIAVRAVVGAARAGTRFDRIAILFPSDRPYARLVEHQLEEAGVPWNGRPGTTDGERMAPRVLAELLELDRRGLRRTELMALLSDVPAMFDGRRTPTALWERVGRAAGVVRGDDWEPALTRFVEEARRQAALDGRPPTEADAARGLMRFVSALRAELGEPNALRPWAEWRAWAAGALERWFGAGRLDRLDGAEGGAWAQTSRVLDRLEHLDGIGGAVTRAEFRATFMAELEITPGRHGKLGDGIHVSTLAGAVGLDVDVVVVLGAAEGLLPPAPVVDPLIGDRERAAAGLAPSDQLAALVHRQFLAATTTTPHALVTVPRGDLRATALRPRTRWLDPLLSSGAERMVDSHAHGLASTTFPVSEGEHRLRELWVCARAGHDVRDLPVATTDAVLRRALALRDARASDDFTIYDGNLVGCGAPALPALVSPTQLEAWAACPHAYFVRHVLGVRPIEEPADVEQLGAADRGIALHAALDRLHRAVIDGELPQPGPAGWTPTHLAHLQQACADVAHELEQRGRTGWAAFWANDRAGLHGVLDAWVANENERWPGSRIVQSERRFDVDDAVALALANGRTVRFKGSIDRVEELPDGCLVVTDHKSGKARGLEKLSVADPTLGATRFQLPVYAAAARATLGRPDADVEARYSFFREDFRTVAIRFDDDVWARVGVALEAVVAGIEAGVFPALPDRPTFRPWVSCHYCEPDELGTAMRWDEWQRKRHAPVLARWFPEPDDIDADARGGDGGDA